MTEFNWLDLHKDANTNLNGEFPVVIVDPVAGESTKGQPQIKFKAKVTEGQFAGRTIPSQFTLVTDSPGAMRMFFSHMSALGLDAKFFSQLPSGSAGMPVLAQALDGRHAVAVIGVRQWNGADRESVDGWKPAVGGAGLGLGGVGGGSLGGTVSSSPLGATQPPAAVQRELGGQPSTPAPTLDDEPPF